MPADGAAVDTAAVDAAVGPPGREQRGDELSSAVRRRLRRIVGQVLGIDRMLDAHRDCRDVLVQLAATQGALRAASRQVFAEHLDRVAAAIAAGTIAPDAAAEDVASLVALLTGGPIATGGTENDHSAGLFRPPSRRSQGWADADGAPDPL